MAYHPSQEQEYMDRLRDRFQPREFRSYGYETAGQSQWQSPPAYPNNGYGHQYPQAYDPQRAYSTPPHMYPPPPQRPHSYHIPPTSQPSTNFGTEPLFLKISRFQSDCKTLQEESAEFRAKVQDYVECKTIIEELQAQGEPTSKILQAESNRYGLELALDGIARRFKARKADMNALLPEIDQALWKDTDVEYLLIGQDLAYVK